MEKIGVKKAFSIESYEFLKFTYFSRFYFDFSGIFQEYLEIKIHKNGVYKRGTRAELTWRDADT